MIGTEVVKKLEHEDESEALEQGLCSLSRVRDWYNLEGDVSIFTHEMVDADAAFSAALMSIVRPDAEIFLVPADTVVDREGSLAVDMISGENGVKGFEEGSAFGELTRILTRLGVIPPRLFTRFADHLNLTDSGKRCNDRIALPGLVLSWRYAGLDDMTIVSRAHEILSGMMTGMEENRTRVNKSRNLPIKDGIALNLTSGGHDRKTLARRGAYMVVVQHEGSGQSVILTSRGQRAGLDLNEVSNQLPDKWFIHPSGFLACYGSRKAPKSPAESGIPLEGLCKIIRDWLVSTLGYVPEAVI